MCRPGKRYVVVDGMEMELQHLHLYLSQQELKKHVVVSL